MDEDKRTKYVSQKILLKDLYRKFDRQSVDNSSFDAKMGMILGFFALYFVGIIMLAIERPYLLSSVLFLLALISGLVAVLVLIAAFYPVTYKDPGKIKASYEKDKFLEAKETTIGILIDAYKEAYETNADRLRRKSKLCKIGLVVFMISITLLFIFVIHSNMNSYQELEDDDNSFSQCDTVEKDYSGSSTIDEDDNSNCDVKTLNEE